MDLTELKAVSQANAQAIAQATAPYKRIIYSLLVVLVLFMVGVSLCAYKFVSVAFETAGDSTISNENNTASHISSIIGS